MATKRTCGECEHLRADGVCIKTTDQRATINLACKSFKQASDYEGDTQLPESAFLTPETPEETKPEVEMATCSQCGRSLPAESLTKGGICPSCFNENLQKRMAKMRAARLEKNQERAERAKAQNTAEEAPRETVAEEAAPALNFKVHLAEADAALIAQLRERGWHGSFTKLVSVEVQL